MPKKEKVDKLITAIPGEWEFDDQVAQGFDDHVRKSVPLYEEIQQMVVEMSEWFVRDNTVVYDLGSSTGQTLRLLREKHRRKKNVKFIGIESSASMIEVARSKCTAKNVRFIHRDVRDIDSFDQPDLVTSLYTIQFLPLKHRKSLLKKIHEELSSGGVFIIVEKVCAENPFLEDMWLELYWDFKKRQGLSDRMILQKSRSLRGVLFPQTLSRNIDLLKSAGFSDIDVFVKWYNFAGIIAFKHEHAHGKKPAKNSKT